jgi:serine/threonine-protein kinase
MTSVPRPPAPDETSDADDPVLGRTLVERYRVTGLLARGGMARVYRARDERLDRDVAVKVLSAPYADDPTFVERFLREARAAASLSHPSLVHVYDSGSDGRHHFIAMELLDRHRSLRLVLEERGRLEVAEAVAVAREVLAGLAVVHDHGLVHCDIKTGNVMLGTGPAKLIDFGIARTPHAPDPADLSIGSLRYMSPEQLRSEPLTPASDLFAVGVLLYEAITGRAPFPGETPEEVAAAHETWRVPAPSTLATGVPDRLDRAILQALRPAPEARFNSAEAMDRALEASLPAREETETRPLARVSPPARADHGYVPPPAPPPVASPARGREGPPRPAASLWRPAGRRIAGMTRLIGTAFVLAAVVLVILLVVVPLLRLGASPGGAGPTSTATPVATAVPSAAPTPAGNNVAVPDTIGRSRDEAIALATEAGLNWFLRCDEDPELPEGIIDQEPGAGTEVPRGSRFTMYSARIADCR